jgi:APA family basic amino acid/polyamine antiporter
VAVAAIGIAPVNLLTGSDAPLAAALREGAGIPWAGGVLALGALIAITSVVLVIMYGQTRIFFAMCRDGLFPRSLARVNPRFGTPARLSIGFGVFIAIMAAFVPLGEIVKLVNIGTLFAFILVNLGVLVLRRTRPDMPRPFRVPFSPVFPMIGIVLCLYLVWQLPGTTWVRFLVWLAIGLAIYFLYSRKHSRLQTDREQAGPSPVGPRGSDSEGGQS